MFTTTLLQPSAASQAHLHSTPLGQSVTGCLWVQLAALAPGHAKPPPPITVSGQFWCSPYSVAGSGTHRPASTRHIPQPSFGPACLGLQLPGGRAGQELNVGSRVDYSHCPSPHGCCLYIGSSKGREEVGVSLKSGSSPPAPSPCCGGGGIDSGDGCSREPSVSRD